MGDGEVYVDGGDRGKGIKTDKRLRAHQRNDAFVRYQKNICLFSMGYERNRNFRKFLCRLCAAYVQVTPRLRGQAILSVFIWGSARQERKVLSLRLCQNLLTSPFFDSSKRQDCAVLPCGQTVYSLAPKLGQCQVLKATNRRLCARRPVNAFCGVFPLNV